MRMLRHGSHLLSVVRERRKTSTSAWPRVLRRRRSRSWEMAGCALGDEVLGLGVVTDDRVGRLLWMQLESFRDRHTDAL